MNTGLNIFTQCYGTRRKHRLFVVQGLFPKTHEVVFACHGCEMTIHRYRPALYKEMTNNHDDSQWYV